MKDFFEKHYQKIILIALILGCLLFFVLNKTANEKIRDAIGVFTFCLFAVGSQEATDSKKMGVKPLLFILIDKNMLMLKKITLNTLIRG